MKRYFLTIAVLALAACTQDLNELEVSTTEGNAATSKLVFTSRNAVCGELLVNFDEAAVERIEKGVSRSGNTRSGIDEFDAILDRIGVKSLNRLFPIDERNEERTRAAGLHRWYIVTFDEEVDLDKAALSMAEVAEVSHIEFNQKMRLVDGYEVMPLDESLNLNTTATTRAIEYQFNDPDLSKQWHYINIGDTSVYSGAKAGADVNCADAWRLCTGDPSIVVAIVDNCVDWTHPDLAANMWINPGEIAGNGIDDDNNGFVDDIHGWNFVRDMTLTLSDEIKDTAPEHGTHVAGTVAAVNNNGKGVCGIAGGSGKGDGVRLMSCQVFYNTGSTSSANTSKAIKYAADNGAAIIQCSYGYEAGSIANDGIYAKGYSAEKSVIDYFIATKNCDAVNGGIAIFAAGNDMKDMSCYPAGYRDYISVTATSCDYTPAYYTNYGPGCNIAAPGGDYYQSAIESNWASSASQVLSTTPTNISKGYGYAQGTSMACPHVSGVAALGLSYAHQLGKTFTTKEFNTLLLTSVNDIDSYCVGEKQYVNTGSIAKLDASRFKGKMGTGLIDAYKVLLNIEGTPYIPVRATGTKQAVDITSIVGGGAKGMTFLGIEMSDAGKTRLGVEGSLSISSTGKLSICCTKAGSAKATVRFIGGGDTVGDDNNMGGLEMSKEFVIISREFARNNGWF